MAYDISLLDPSSRERLSVEQFAEGGTQVLGGSTVACLNITSNYRTLFDFYELHDKVAHETIPSLIEAVVQLGTERNRNHWAPTPGNVGFACDRLLSWACRYPDAIWRVY